MVKVVNHEGRQSHHMSQRKGDSSKRAQKYQNSRAFKPGLYGVSRRVKLAASLPLAGICGRCKEKIEWKKKYDKYKPLTAPKRCVICAEKRVKQAYYTICQVCARGRNICAKCGEKEEIVTSFPPSAREQTKEEAEFRQNLKFMSERDRRKLLREQLKGITTKSQDTKSQDTYSNQNNSDCESEEECHMTDHVTDHMATDLTGEIAVLTLAETKDCS